MLCMLRLLYHAALPHALPRCPRFPPHLTPPSAAPPWQLQLGSRYFSFYRDGSTDKTANHLVPFIDLINHSDEPNAARSGERALLAWGWV